VSSSSAWESWGLGELSVVLVVIIGELGLELPLGDVPLVPGLRAQGRVRVQLDLRAVDEVEGRVLGAPPGHVHELQGVVLRDELALAGDVDVPEPVLVVLGAALEHPDGEEPLEVGDGGERGHPDELPVQLGQQLGVGRLEHQVDLLVEPMEVHGGAWLGGGLGLGLLGLALGAGLLLQVLGAGHAALRVEIPLPPVLVLLEGGHQLVHDVLHRPVERDVVEGVGLVDHHLTLGAVDIVLQVLHYAALEGWVPGASRASGASKVPGIRCQVPGASKVPGSRCQVPGARCSPCRRCGGTR